VSIKPDVPLDDDHSPSRALKYSRLKGKVPEILAKDSASAVDVSPRVVVSLDGPLALSKNTSTRTDKSGDWNSRRYGACFEL
jgi:hypothetical protein